MENRLSIRRVVAHLLGSICLGFREHAWEVALEGRLGHIGRLIRKEIFNDDGFVKTLTVYKGNTRLLESVEEPVVQQIMKSKRKLREFKLELDRLIGNEGNDAEQKVNARGLALEIYSKHFDARQKQRCTKPQAAALLYLSMRMMLLECVKRMEHQDWYGALRDDLSVDRVLEMVWVLDEDLMGID